MSTLTIEEKFFLDLNLEIFAAYQCVGMGVGWEIFLVDYVNIT